MELPELVPIEYRGTLVALVSARRVHIVDPVLRARPTGDPELRFVAFMCLCCGEVLRGRLPGPYTNELGEAWARLATDGDAGATEAALDTPAARVDDDRDGPGPVARTPHRGDRR
jgi:hypothetical protein